MLCTSTRKHAFSVFAPGPWHCANYTPVVQNACHRARTGYIRKLPRRFVLTTFSTNSQRGQDSQNELRFVPRSIHKIYFEIECLSAPQCPRNLKNNMFSSFSAFWVLLHGSRALPHGVPAPVPARASPGNLPGVPHPYPLYLKSNDLGILWGLPGRPPQCLLSFKSGDLGLLWVRLGTCRPSYVVTSANQQETRTRLGGTNPYQNAITID